MFTHQTDEDAAYTSAGNIWYALDLLVQAECEREEIALDTLLGEVFVDSTECSRETIEIFEVRAAELLTGAVS